MPNVAVHSEISTIVANVAGVTVLIACYVFGVWLRNYIYPTDSTTPLKRQLMAAIPIGLVTMGVYAKTSFPGLDYTHDGVFDGSGLASGEAIQEPQDALAAGFIFHLPGIAEHRRTERLQGLCRPPGRPQPPRRHFRRQLQLQLQHQHRRPQHGHRHHRRRQASDRHDLQIQPLGH